MKKRKNILMTAATLVLLGLLAGCTDASAVTLEEAKDLVKEQVGDTGAIVVEQETDREDGVYELEIIVDGVAYDFEVDSRTGTVRSVEREDDPPRRTRPAETAPAPAATQPAETAPAPAATQPAETVPAPAATQPSRISAQEALAIAYAHAGVSEADVHDRSCEQDDGRYEIDFDCGGYEYEYHISYRGEVLHAHREKEHDHRHSAPAATEPAVTQPAQTQPKQEQSDRISAQEALAIALAHAGVTDARDKDVEWDDGRWEVSFDTGRTEYEYHISADGAILRSEKEYDD